MSNKSSKPAHKNNAPDAEEKIENALGKTGEWFVANSKALIIALVVVVLVVGGYFGYRYLIQEPNMHKAENAMFVAEQLFAAEDYSAALNGNGLSEGFLDIVDSYGSTPQGRLAAHYAGICYLKMGEYDNALTYLQRYKTRSGAPAAVLNAQNLGLQGDIYVQKGDYRKAAEMFDKAVKAGNNVLATPYYLKKYAQANEKLGNIQAAIDACERIRIEYGSSIEAQTIEKYIGKLQQL